MLPTAGHAERPGSLVSKVAIWVSLEEAMCILVHAVQSGQSHTNLTISLVFMGLLVFFRYHMNSVLLLV